MKKIIIVAVIAISCGLGACLLSGRAQALQYGATVGYSSLGFQLHGASVEFLLGINSKDKHRPQGSVWHFGFAGTTGNKKTNLTQATWNGLSIDNYLSERAGGGATAQQIAAQLRGLEIETSSLYGISDLSAVKIDSTAYAISLAYEYVFTQKVPGFGLLVGFEAIIEEGTLSDSKTTGGGGGGGLFGISYYWRNGFVISAKTALGWSSLGDGNLLATNDRLGLPAEFYATPTFSIGFIR